MQIQTGEYEVKRGVCFSPPRIDEFNKHSKCKSPVKISKFRLDKSSTSVCMGPDVQLSQVVIPSCECGIEIPVCELQCLLYR